MRRSLLLATAGLLALGLPPQRARATVDAVDEDETQTPPPAAPAKAKVTPARREALPAAAAAEGGDETETPPEVRRPRRESQRQVPVQPPAPAARVSTPIAAANAPDAGVAPVHPEAILASAKGPILLPKGSFADLLAAFRARRQALVEQNLAQVKAQSSRLREIRETLGFPDLFSAADALCREARRELQSGLKPQALDSATLAVELAPDLPESWWVLGRAQLAQPGFAGLAPAGASFVAAAQAEWREPRYARALLGNVAASGVLAALIAGALALALFLIMTLRYSLHDFHHLFPRAVSLVQTSMLGVILLAIPWLFHLGTFAALASFALASWLYLQRGERVAAGLALAALVGAPFLLGAIARRSALSPLGEDLYTIDRDLDSDLAAAKLQALAQGPKPSYPVLAGLASRAKRLGRYDEAGRLYRRALEAFPGQAGAETNLGNVLFIQGDLAGAKALYESAIGHDPGVAAAYFDLGQVFNRLLLLEQSQQAQRQALELDRALVEAHVAGDDLRANRYLVDVTLPWAEIAGAGSEDLAAGIRAQAEGRLFGPLAGAELPVAGGVALALLLLGLGRSRLRPCSQCVKCGRPVCGRCDVGLAGDGLCGQCVNVFIRRSASDPPARIRKEARVRAYQSFRQTTVRGLAIVLGGAGQLASGKPLVGLGILWAGAFLLLNALGASDLLRAPVPGLWAVRFVLFALPLLPLYGLSVRAVFREDR